MNADPHFPTPYFRNYATLASPVVCATDDPAAQQSRPGRKGVRFYAGGAGTVVVRPPGGTGSTDQSFTMVAGGYQNVEFDRLVSGTATNVVVYWSRSLL